MEKNLFYVRLYLLTYFKFLQMPNDRKAKSKKKNN